MTRAAGAIETSGAAGARWTHTLLERRFQWMMAAVVAIVAPADLLLARHAELTGVGLSGTVWGVLALFAAVDWYCRWRPLPRLVESCEMAMWAVFFTNALSVLIQIAGRSRRPLVDAQLAGLDGRMHFATSAVVHAAAGMPAVRMALAVLYALVALIILLSIVLLPFVGYGDVSRRYIAGIVFAAVVTAGVFALWPAAGPWTTEGFRPTRDQAAVTAYLTALKSAGPVAVNMKQAAIVAFPSFHVVLAILSAAALGAIRRLRAWVWSGAALMCVATLTTGWHYLTDVLGGLALAGLTLAAVEYALPSSRIQYRRFPRLMERQAEAAAVTVPVSTGEEG